MTRPSIAMRSPFGFCAVRSLHSGRASPIWKNGPTVCDGVGISFAAISAGLDRCRRAAAQHDVPVIAERPFGLAQIRIVIADQALARVLVGGALVDRIVGEERVTGEVH